MTSPTRLLVKDELVGFAKSKVMLVLWVALPVLATAGYFLLPNDLGAEAGEQPEIPLTYMMGIFVSSIAGTIAAVMVSVDIVSEKSRKVYELFIIRPISRNTIIWAKFIAVFFCVTVASVISLTVGIAVDTARGVDLPPGLFTDTLRSLGSVVGVIGISTAVGVFFGVVSNSILVAVILILYVGQNLTLIPLLPAYMGLGEKWYWILLGATVVTTAVVMFFAGMFFRRAEF